MKIELDVVFVPPDRTIVFDDRDVVITDCIFETENAKFKATERDKYLHGGEHQFPWLDDAQYVFPQRTKE